MIRLLIGGDYCPQYRINSMLKKGDYSFLRTLKDLVNELNPNLTILNLECPIEDESHSPITKIGMNLDCDRNVVDSLKYAGVNLVTLANNHIKDFGSEGILSTIKACKDKDIETIGAGKNIEEAEEIKYYEFNDKTLAIINCCEHEYSIAAKNEAGAAPLDIIKQINQIKEAKSKADKIIIIVHGGPEYYNLPTTRMKRIYHFFVDCGADVVINGHQHCYSGYEIYKGAPIFYGLGNFCFDSKNNEPRCWYSGLMVFIEIDEKINFKLYPLKQAMVDLPSPSLLPLNAFDSTIILLNNIISDDNLLEQHEKDYYESFNKEFRILFEGSDNKIIRFLQKKRLWPIKRNSKYYNKILNRVACEAHRDKLLYNLKNLSKLDS